MANQKTTELENNTTIDDTDLIVIVDDVTGTPVNEKRTFTNLKAFLKTYFDSVTTTFTNKRVTKRVTTEASSATPTINTDNSDLHRITALAVNVTSMTTNLSGTPTSMQPLGIEVTPTATRTVTWGASFESSETFTLPTEFTGTATVLYMFYWNTITSKWRYAGTV